MEKHEPPIFTFVPCLLLEQVMLKCLQTGDEVQWRGTLLSFLPCFVQSIRLLHRKGLLSQIELVKNMAI